MTPKSYLSFINGYKAIYSEKREQIDELARRMNTGLDKLMEASESVTQLSRELAVKEKELAVASDKADKVRLKLPLERDSGGMRDDGIRLVSTIFRETTLFLLLKIDSKTPPY